MQKAVLEACMTISEKLAIYAVFMIIGISVLVILFVRDKKKTKGGGADGNS